ncbi:MAG: SurA N-terminal domain-containing protein [Nitrospirae bacterium]|nr:SurA N-terminal domain-containing protein [Nitrospirota bacterium]
MLKLMRSHKFFTVFLLSAVTIMIIITFVFWGIGPKENPSAIVVAQVKNKKIAQQEYWRVHDNAERYYREIFKNEEDIKRLNLKEKVINDLIDREVLMIAAEDIGIRVTDKELQEAIVSNPLFHRNGVFSRDVYLRALKLNRVIPKEYESALKNEMVLNKMHRLIGESGLDIKAYIEGLKQQMKITVNSELL